MKRPVEDDVDPTASYPPASLQIPEIEFVPNCNAESDIEVEC